MVVFDFKGQVHILSEVPNKQQQISDIVVDRTIDSQLALSRKAIVIDSRLVVMDIHGRVALININP